MNPTVKEKRDAFRKLHEHGYFVLPNPCDVGSARMLQHLGHHFSDNDQNLGSRLGLWVSHGCEFVAENVALYTPSLIHR